MNGALNTILQKKCNCCCNKPFFIKIFRGGLIPYNKNEPLTQKTEVDSLKSDNIEDYKGANEAYYKVLDHYIKLYETKYGKDIKKMIKEEFPPVGDGPLISAFHGIIQLGYGYVAGSDSVRGLSSI